jgi:hypothetical protein
MAGLVPITRKTETLQAFQLTSQTDMVTALDYLGNGGYSGSITLGLTSTGTKQYQMWINNPGQSNSQNAVTGDWIVIANNTVATVVPAAQFANLYSTS